MKSKELIIVEELKERFDGEILKIDEPDNKRIYLLINPDSLTEISKFLYKKKKARFIIASGLHSKIGFEIIYHYSMDETGHIINLQAILPHEDPEIESLTNLFSAAEWIEREIHEILGIKFRGHPNLVPLISKDNWPEDTYPYRKDFKA